MSEPQPDIRPIERFIDSFAVCDLAPSPRKWITDAAKKWLAGVYAMTFGHPIDDAAELQITTYPVTVEHWNAIPQTERDYWTALAITDRWPS
jgi:hypothetical protein